MKLDEIVAWYQKKIGTYDKQQWEKTVEQKILDGFSSVTLKNAKLKTELIDVDLVRGSTFPKAKPKQTLLTVIRLAILRYLLLPIYSQWWVRQTSPNIFALILFLYITQMINWGVYTFNIHRLESTANNSTNNNNATSNHTNLHSAEVLENNVEEHVVSLTELLIPMALSLLLSLIHSQIVATNSSSGIKSKHRRFSNTSLNGKAPREARLRRRKKLVKVRNQEFSDGSTVNLLTGVSTQQRRLNAAPMKFNAAVDNLSKSTHVPLETATANLSNIQSKQETFQSSTTGSIPVISHRDCQLARNSSMITTITPSSTLKLDLSSNGTTPSTALDCLADNNNPTSILSKKRNVNWHSPIHNYAVETQEKQQQTSPQVTVSSTTSSESSSPCAGSNCSSSSSSCNTNGAKNFTISTPKTVRIDESVQEFFDDLISQTVVESTDKKSIGQCPSVSPRLDTLSVKRNIGEDDGFESLNGKSSSGEETNSPLPTTSLPPVGGRGPGSGKNQLRLRLNAGDIQTTTRTELDADGNSKPALQAGYRRLAPLSSESDYDGARPSSVDISFNHAKKNQQQQRSAHESTDETDEEGCDDGEIISSPASIGNNSNYNECTTSATEWLGVTTNSEDCSYSSDLNNSDDYKKRNVSDDDYDGYDLDFTPTTILNPHGTTADHISCTIWDQREIKKAQMSVLEISSCIIERVESMPETKDYIYIGIFFSVILSFIPSFCRLCEVTIDSENPSEINYLDVPMLLWEKASFSFMAIFHFAFGHTQWERTVLIIGLVQRLCLTMILFIIFAVAERTFKQRFLYAKLFSHLTSSRRAKKSNLPHFRLNKVRNIKTWLSVRSYLKKRGPQRSVDVIVSAAFIVTLLLLAFLSVEWLKDSVHLHSHLNLEALMWSTTIGIFLLRFMTLGNKIHHKYRSVSVLITEQINLYLQIEQKPKKKDELMVSNSVLKLAADLLKELESPFKISGLSANPYLFTTIKVVILSALSGVLSEMLGFKLKLHKIKIK